MRRLLAIVTVLHAAACDRLLNLEHVEARDPDARAEAGAFGAPQPVTELNDGVSFSDDPTLTSNELDIVFTTGRDSPGSCDLYVSSRASIGAPWAAPTPLPGLVNDAECQSGATISGDGLTLWYTTGGDIYVSSRGARGDPFPAGTYDAQLSTGATEGAPSISLDQLTMVFSSDSSGSSDLYLATRMSPGAPWNAPTVIAELASAADERSPFLSPDGLTLWFSYGSGADNDIYVATRATADAPFAPATRLYALSTIGREDDPWVSLDGNRIYFARYPAGAEPGAIYMATR